MWYYCLGECNFQDKIVCCSYLLHGVDEHLVTSEQLSLSVELLRVQIACDLMAPMDYASCYSQDSGSQLLHIVIMRNIVSSRNHANKATSLVRSNAARLLE